MIMEAASAQSVGVPSPRASQIGFLKSLFEDPGKVRRFVQNQGSTEGVTFSYDVLHETFWAFNPKVRLQGSETTKLEEGWREDLILKFTHKIEEYRDTHSDFPGPEATEELVNATLRDFGLEGYKSSEVENSAAAFVVAAAQVVQAAAAVVMAAVMVYNTTKFNSNFGTDPTDMKEINDIWNQSGDLTIMEPAWQRLEPHWQEPKVWNDILRPGFKLSPEDTIREFNPIPENIIPDPYHRNRVIDYFQYFQG